MSGLYAYQMIIGSFDTQTFGDQAVPLVWIFFLGCTVIGNIIMLNLLISIISDTYSKVVDNADSRAYQEMAALICENSFIIPLISK